VKKINLQPIAILTASGKPIEVADSSDLEFDVVDALMSLLAHPADRQVGPSWEEMEDAAAVRDKIRAAEEGFIEVTLDEHAMIVAKLRGARALFTTSDTHFKFWQRIYEAEDTTTKKGND
jgi:hypothetical protein